jgi:hypothetical protein
LERAISHLGPRLADPRMQLRHIGSVQRIDSAAANRGIDVVLRQASQGSRSVGPSFHRYVISNVGLNQIGDAFGSPAALSLRSRVSAKLNPSQNRFRFASCKVRIKFRQIANNNPALLR